MGTEILSLTFFKKMFSEIRHAVFKENQNYNARCVLFLDAVILIARNIDFSYHCQITSVARTINKGSVKVIWLFFVRLLSCTRHFGDTNFYIFTKLQTELVWKIIELLCSASGDTPC